MYKNFYNMHKEPFDNYPLTNVFYNSNVHHDAWRYLAQGIKKKEPILFVTGEYGTGKTLLCLKLVKIFIDKKEIPFIFIPTPNYSFSMTLKKIINVLGISSNATNSCSSDESDLLNIIYEYFEKIDNTNGKYIYIIIDEAQDISYSFANKLKLLISFNASEHFPFRIIMFGHMNFLEILGQKKLVSLKQRIKKIFYLQPFGFNETKEYIYFRLIYSGASGTPVFDDSAIRIIQSASAGTPRLINNICDTCLVEASSNKITYIDADFIENILQKNMNFEKKDIGFPETDDTPETLETHENIKSMHAPAHETDDETAENRYYTNNNQTRQHQRQNRDSSNQRHYASGEEINKETIARKPIERGPIEKIYSESVPEDKNTENKSLDSKKKPLLNNKTGLIFILIVIIIILSYILFSQTQSANIPGLKKKIGNNFIKNNNKIACYDDTKTLDVKWGNYFALID